MTVRKRSGVGGLVQLRNACVSDARVVTDIHVRSFQKNFAGLVAAEFIAAIDVPAREAIWLARIADSHDSGCQLHIAELDGRVVAFAWAGPLPDKDAESLSMGHLFSLHVDPALTGSGIGSVLLAHVESALRQASYAVASLWVVVGNSSARRFYQRQGWQPDGSYRVEPLGLEGEPGPQADVVVVRYRRDL